MESQLFFINEKYREEKEIMENKIEELEKNLKQSQEVLIEKDQKFKNLMRIHDADIVHLITQGLISKIEFNEMQIVLNESIEDRKMTRVSKSLILKIKIKSNLKGKNFFYE